MTRTNPGSDARSTVDDPHLRALGRLVGTWEVSGGAEGAVTYDWMEGGRFLVQRVDLEHDAKTTKGVEIIGRLRPLGGDPSEEIVSRFYESTGSTLDYVYELSRDTLTIWSGERGSPAYYSGIFSDDGETLTGCWVYPGGGYESVDRRSRGAAAASPGGA